MARRRGVFSSGARAFMMCIAAIFSRSRRGQGATVTMGAGGAGTRLRPLALSDVLDETFRIYRRQFRALVLVMGVVSVPLTILSIIVIAVGGTLGLQALAAAGPN